MTEPIPQQRPRGRARWLVLALVLAAALVGATLVVLYALGGGPVPGFLAWLTPKPVDPLAPSGAAESTLRTLRLAGFDSAVVGERGGTVVVRVAMPEIVSPRAVELSWQTALTAGAVAYPRSGKVVAQLFTGSVPLLEVTADADAVREATRRDDPSAVRRAASFRYLATAAGSP